jgi:hypothetical protein
VSQRDRVRRLCALTLLAGLAAGPAGAERASLVYRAQHRGAGELLPLVETALAGEATVALDPGTNSLVFEGEGRAIAVALELLAVQDRALRTLVVRVESQRTSALARDGMRVEWVPTGGELRLGRLRTGAPPAAPDEGGSPVLGSGAAVRADTARARGDGEFSAVVRILEGEIGQIASGPLGPPGGPRDVAPLGAGPPSGLLARAHLLGEDHVQLDLAPGAGEGGEEAELALARAATRAVLAPGETLVVGGLRRGEARPPGEGEGSAVGDRVLLLRVGID